MRIAYLTHQYLPDHIGGTETYVHALARRSIALGHEVLIISHKEVEPTVPQHEISQRVFEGADVVEIGSNLSRAPNIARSEYNSRKMRRRIRKILEEWKPDVAHAAHILRLTIGALQACRDLKVPVILSLVDFWAICPRATLLRDDGRLCPGPMQWRERLECLHDLHGVDSRASAKRAVRRRPARVRDAILTADEVIAFTSFLKETFVQNGYPPDRISIVPLGVEAESLRGFQRPVRATQHTRLLFIGNLVRHKGLHLVIDGMRKVPDAPVRLDVFGATPDTPYVHELFAKAEGDARISFNGTFPGNDLGRVFSGAHYLAAPSIWYENAPLVIQAAVQLGVPVLTHRLGSLTEMIDTDETGYFVQPTADDWASAIRMAHERRDNWSRVGRTLASMDHHFSWVMSRYEALAG